MIKKASQKKTALKGGLNNFKKSDYFKRLYPVLRPLFFLAERASLDAEYHG